VREAASDRYGADLLSSPVLPAKANLIGRFTGRGERPLYVDVPNPMHGVSR
jgi:siderophore synthetase component